MFLVECRMLSVACLLSVAFLRLVSSCAAAGRKRVGLDMIRSLLQCCCTCGRKLVTVSTTSTVRTNGSECCASLQIAPHKVFSGNKVRMLRSVPCKYRVMYVDSQRSSVARCLSSTACSHAVPTPYPRVVPAWYPVVSHSHPGRIPPDTTWAFLCNATVGAALGGTAGEWCRVPAWCVVCTLYAVYCSLCVTCTPAQRTML